MGVVIKDGVGFSVKDNNGRLFMSAAGIASYGEMPDTKNAAAPEDLSSAPWSPWGSTNKLPIDLAEHIENCGVLSAALDAKARIAMGKGFQPFLLTNITPDGKEELEWVGDAEIQDWLEENRIFDFGVDTVFDNSAYGWACGSFIKNLKGDKIGRMRRIDVSTARMQKMSGNQATPKSLFLCNDWSNASSAFNKDKMIQLNTLREGYEFQDLQEATRSESAFIIRNKRNSRSYYPMPLWYAARAWVKVARSVPAFKNAMFANSIQLKYVISISDKYWQFQYGSEWNNYTQKKKDDLINQKYDEIDAWLTGEEKAFKSISSGFYFDPVTQKEVPFIKIDVLDDKVKDGKLLPESSAANSEILFALMMNPALIGAGQPGGPYSNNAGGSNIRESYLIQLMINEAERKCVANNLNIVKRFNGWSSRLEKEQTIVTSTTSRIVTPRLVFRCISGMLTTLDTGKSTKNEPL